MVGLIVGGLAVTIVGFIVAKNYDFIEDFIGLVQKIFEFAQDMLKVIPSPFGIIIGVFLAIYLSVILYKVVRN